MKKRAPARRTKVTGSCSAGPDHQVLTLKSKGGDGCVYRREPCPQCPWRVDAVGVFPAAAFRCSADTAYDMADRMFGCHDSGLKHPATCAGFLLRNSANHLGVRLALGLDLAEVSDGGHALFASYREMAIANGVSPDDPVLLPCRADDD